MRTGLSTDTGKYRLLFSISASANLNQMYQSSCLNLPQESLSCHFETVLYIPFISAKLKLNAFNNILCQHEVM